MAKKHNIKLKEIIESSETLEKLTKIKFPAVIAFQISRVYNILLPEITNFNKQKNSLITEYGEPKEEGSTIYSVNDPEKQKIVISKIEELGNLEISVEFDPILAKDISIDIEPELFIPWLFE